MATKSVNSRLADQFVTMTANMSRLSESEILTVTGILKELELGLVAELADNPKLTQYTKRRFEALITQNKSTINAAYKKIGQHNESFLTEIAGITQAGSGKAFKAIGVPINSVVLTSDQLKTLASNSLIEGAPSAAWWAKQNVNLRDAFSQQMKIGYAGGETIDQLVQRVRGTATGVKHPYLINDKIKWFNEFEGGIMDTGTRQAQTLVRTSVQQISADSRLAMFQQNADVLKGVTWVSTLDGRTTILCASRDGLAYDLQGNPIGHKLPFLGGPPAHWGCRSALAPLVKSFEELGATPGTDKKWLGSLDDATRASIDGQVPQITTFDSWFGGLTEADQIAYLGPRKFEIWKDAGLTMSEMADQFGNPLTLQQLADAYGYKIQQSKLSGIPNIPAKLENAIVLSAKMEQISSIMSTIASETVAGEALIDGVVTIGTKTYDLSEPIQFSAFKKHRQRLLTDYRKAVRAGIAPSEASLTAFDTLPQQEKLDLLAKLGISTNTEKKALIQAKELVVKPAEEVAKVLAAKSTPATTLVRSAPAVSEVGAAEVIAKWNSSTTAILAAKAEQDSAFSFALSYVDSTLPTAAKSEARFAAANEAKQILDTHSKKILEKARTAAPGSIENQAWQKLVNNHGGAGFPQGYSMYCMEYARYVEEMGGPAAEKLLKFSEVLGKQQATLNSVAETAIIGRQQAAQTLTSLEFKAGGEKAKNWLVYDAEKFAGASDDLNTAFTLIRNQDPRLTQWFDQTKENKVIFENWFGSRNGTSSPISGIVSINGNVAPGFSIDLSATRWSTATGRASVIVHEYGHDIVRVLRQNTIGPEFNRVAAKQFSDSIVDTAFKESKKQLGMSKKEFISSISGYAGADSDEAIAEAFRDYVINGKQTRPASAAIVKRLFTMMEAFL